MDMIGQIHSPAPLLIATYSDVVLNRRTLSLQRIEPLESSHITDQTIISETADHCGHPLDLNITCNPSFSRHYVFSDQTKLRWRINRKGSSSPFRSSSAEFYCPFWLHQVMGLAPFILNSELRWYSNATSRMTFVKKNHISKCKFLLSKFSVNFCWVSENITAGRIARREDAISIKNYDLNLVWRLFTVDSTTLQVEFFGLWRYVVLW
jgi:hypothetical protein